MDWKKEYEKWCQDPCFDEDTREELLALKGEEEEIKDRFYRRLSFGTGGLRGVIGAGTNRMNIYTVRQATQGLANYIIAQNQQKRGVAISCDSRIMSPEFARETALCLNANGIPTFLFESLRPTPELSFAVRQLHCVAGVMVTASHNPREYNGYKVYWEDGAQITPPHDKQIIAKVNAVTDFSMIRSMAEDDARAQGLFHVIGTDFDELYLEQLKIQSIHPDVVRKMADDFCIVYTPLNGTGNVPVRRILSQLGFSKVYVVDNQKEPDGNFPTLPYPNPEDPGAWEHALKLAEKVDADIVLATDPDADRLGLYAKDENTGEYVRFNGNMTGILMADYILSQKAALKQMPENPVIVDTIVSTDMAKPLAKAYGAELVEVLTGFKYIGEQIRFYETDERGRSFLFGFEESYGALAGTHARDKDACVAVMMLCEAAAFYKSMGISLCEAMENLYKKYGYYGESLASETRKGSDGAKQIKKKMEQFRNETPEKIGGLEVRALRDYKSGVRREIPGGGESVLTLPESDVLYFELEKGAWCCVRPSGTEPKIKYYFGVKGDSREETSLLLKKLEDDILSES